MKENREESYCASLQSFIIAKLHKKNKNHVSAYTNIYIVQSSITKVIQQYT